MVTKRNVLFASGLITLGLFAIGIFGTYKLCNDNENCVDVLHQFFLHFFPVTALFLFSFITYWMREEVYKAWFKFARWAIPLSMFLILIAPEYSHDRMYPIEKGSIALLCSVIFVIVSIVIVAWKYFKIQSR